MQFHVFISTLEIKSDVCVLGLCMLECLFTYLPDRAMPDLKGNLQTLICVKVNFCELIFLCSFFLLSCIWFYEKIDITLST